MFTFRVSLAFYASVIVDCETKDLTKVLKKAIVAFEDAGSDVLYEIEEIERLPENLKTDFVFIDAKMEGAKRQHYIPTTIFIEQLYN